MVVVDSFSNQPPQNESNATLPAKIGKSHLLDQMYKFCETIISDYSIYDYDIDYHVLNRK